MGRITLHVGAGKCGSTAIQDALTHHPVVPLDGGRAVYVVIDSKGNVTAGPRVKPSSLGQARRAAAHEQLSQLSPLRIRAIRRALSAIDNPIMSCERYLCAHKPGREFLDRLDLPVHVVAYVRPQVDYVNSAFWQWEAWTGKTREEWIRVRIRRSLWHERVSKWALMPQVEKVTVRLLPGNVVTDFLGVLGARADAIPPQRKANPALPGQLLRFLQKHPGLHETFADELIWIFPDLLEGLDLGPVPWVVTPDAVERILRETRSDNERLLTLLDADSADRMRSDPRWWDAGAYSGRTAEPLRLAHGDPGPSDALLADLFESAARIASERRARAASWLGFLRLGRGDARR